MSESWKTVLVPRWTRETPKNIQLYAEQLETAKKHFSSEQDLIYASISLSDRTDLLGIIPTTARESLTEYIKFLHQNFGLSLNERRRIFANMRQAGSETLTEFWFKCVQAYRNSKMTAPNTLDQDDQQAIVMHFIDGLSDKQIKRQMLLDDVEFENALKRARHIELVLRSE